MFNIRDEVDIGRDILKLIEQGKSADALGGLEIVFTESYHHAKTSLFLTSLLKDICAKHQKTLQACFYTVIKKYQDSFNPKVDSEYQKAKNWLVEKQYLDQFDSELPFVLEKIFAVFLYDKLLVTPSMLFFMMDYSSTEDLTEYQEIIVDMVKNHPWDGLFDCFQATFPKYFSQSKEVA